MDKKCGSEPFFQKVWTLTLKMTWKRNISEKKFKNENLFGANLANTRYLKNVNKWNFCEDFLLKSYLIVQAMLRIKTMRKKKYGYLDFLW
jgi:hypothetical protein